MAHPEHIKAQALALLALGNTPRYVAEKLNIPRTTARRWQVEARTWMRAEFPELADVAREVFAIFPGLQQNGPKKEKRGGA